MECSFSFMPFPCSELYFSYLFHNQFYKHFHPHLFVCAHASHLQQKIRSDPCMGQRSSKTMMETTTTSKLQLHRFSLHFCWPRCQIDILLLAEVHELQHLSKIETHDANRLITTSPTNANGWIDTNDFVCGFSTMILVSGP